MPKPRFVELKFADTGSYPRHSLTGYFVISECRNQGNIELFLRLPDQDAGPRTVREATERKPRRKTTKRVSKSVGSGTQTEFPGPEVSE